MTEQEHYPVPARPLRPTRERRDWAPPTRGAVPVYSRRLREARLARGLSQRHLGSDAGLPEAVASTRINRYEKGAHQPDLQTMQKLAAVLGCPLAYFYAEDDDLAKLILAFARRR
ncbi:helix-turn-helix domain-containing protein [Coralloluteibacterium stylophorae]|uniref:Helix-turn-helix transcriptional regulator n=1 Tax=Coralloluteibacterium stylophorae TaxID=1776034 RepID=A0A8J7VVG5_9GAMM|nr:helix-turn-helix transcriptional regulator [Coralloluteibacterium stylophorae]